MAKLGAEDIVKKLTGIAGDNLSDDVLALAQDIKDSVGDGGEWEQKYKENDAAWRKKYMDAFSGSVEKPKEEEQEEEEEPERKWTYDELFKNEEGK